MLKFILFILSIILIVFSFQHADGTISGVDFPELIVGVILLLSVSINSKGRK